MPLTFDRRSFLQTSAAASVGLSCGPWPRGAAAEAKEPLFKISLAEWSLHNALFGKKLDHRDFAPTARTKYGIEAAEFVNQFFKDKAKDRKYLSEVKQRADDAGVKILLIMCDGEGSLGDPNEPKRKQAVENHYKW